MLGEFSLTLPRKFPVTNVRMHFGERQQCVDDERVLKLIFHQKKRTKVAATTTTTTKKQAFNLNGEVQKLVQKSTYQ